MKFTEAKLEQAIISHLQAEGYTYVSGKEIIRDPAEVLLKEDLKDFLLVLVKLIKAIRE